STIQLSKGLERIEKYAVSAKTLSQGQTGTEIPFLHGKIRKILQPGNKKNAREVVNELNPVLIGWRNYYNAPGTYPRKVFRDVNWYLQQRIYRFYRRKSRRRSKLYGRRACEHLIKSGLVIL
ncbi:hypothetical protein JW935_01785, partial [candidate division KSB1 bacterium]|nr:hypothetical protein [candidate division KSB1 bacterium]